MTSSLTQFSGSSLEVQATNLDYDGKTVDLDTESTIDIDAIGAITIDGQSTGTIKTAGALNISSSGALEVSGSSVNIGGATSVDIKEGDVTIIGIDDNRDVLFTQTGGTYNDPDVDVSGYFKVQEGSKFIGDISASGMLSASGGITASSIWASGDIHAVGNITFEAGTSGVISLGTGADDNISASGDFTSHLIPNADDSYNLGSETQRWNNVYVSGSISASGGPHDIDSDTTIA